MTMARILIIDYETPSENGVEQCEWCEFAALLYNVSPNPRECGELESVSMVFPIADENRYEWLNKITPELASMGAIALHQKAFTLEQTIISFCPEYVTAFNAEFDEQLFRRHFQHSHIGQLPVFCSMKDVDWSFPGANKYNTFALINLAIYLGVPIGNAHRAMDDVRLLARCFDTRKNGLYGMIGDAIALSQSPKITVKALVKYEEKELAKEAGFAPIYQNSKFSHWEKTIRKCEYQSLESSVSFELEILS